MRELVITLEYEPGIDPVMDVFIDRQRLVSKSVDISIGVGGLTRVDRLSGPAEAIDSVVEVYHDPSVCNECTVPDGRCDADRSYEVLAHGENTRTVYTYHQGVTFCNSVPFYGATKLSAGLLFDSYRRGDTHEWRILMRDDRGIGELFDALTDDLPSGVSVSFERLTSLKRWGAYTGTVADLSPEQRETIETAVRMDYYATPRGATLADLSETLGEPQSTVRYRLRRAEAWLTNSVVAAQRSGRRIPVD